MAGGTILGSHLTNLGAGLSAGMARLALRIVVRRDLVDALMWIVTRRTANPGIIHIEALTIGQPVWLKTDIAGIVRPVRRHVIPGPVAPTAKLRGVLGCHAA